MEERKATDILLSIEEKLSLLLKYYSNIDHNQKIVLSNQKTILSKLQNTIELDKTQMPVEIKSSPAPMSVEAFFPTPSVAIGKTPTLDIESLIKSDPKNKTARLQSINDKLVQVQQKITYPDGKNVILANVEIFQQGKNIKKTKTNSAGKWSAKLAPGQYIVHITRGKVNDLPPIDFRIPFELIPSEGIIELESPR